MRGSAPFRDLPREVAGLPRENRKVPTGGKRNAEPCCALIRRLTKNKIFWLRDTLLP